MKLMKKYTYLTFNIDLHFATFNNFMHALKSNYITSTKFFEYFLLWLEGNFQIYLKLKTLF